MAGETNPHRDGDKTRTFLTRKLDRLTQWGMSLAIFLRWAVLEASLLLASTVLNKKSLEQNSGYYLRTTTKIVLSNAIYSMGHT